MALSPAVWSAGCSSGTTAPDCPTGQVPSGDGCVANTNPVDNDDDAPSDQLRAQTAREGAGVMRTDGYRLDLKRKLRRQHANTANNDRRVN